MGGLPDRRTSSMTQLRSIRSRSWRTLLSAAVTGLLAVAGTAPLIGLAPEPDAVPRRWELQVDASDLRLVTIDVPNIGARKYLYMTFKATNNSGQDMLFAPSFELSDGDGHVYRSGRDVPLFVTQQLLAQTQNPFIQDQIGVIGELLQGAENTKDGLVIWPVDAFNPSQVTVYAAGFSGETKTVISPDGKSKFVLRKTLRLEFQPPGDLSGPASETIPVSTRSWIMR
jgi:hypothetical protein